MKIGLPCDIKYPMTQGWEIPKDPKLKYWYEKELGLKDGRHNGCDFGTPIGTEIWATHDGTVRNVPGEVSGNFLYLYDDSKQIDKTIYGHLSKFLCKDGQKVKKGDLIALSGNTGRYTTGPHLHFGVYQKTNPDNGMNGAVNPIPFMAEELKEGELIKNAIENKVFIIRNNYKWWIFDEETFENFMGIKVNKAVIKTINLLTFNFYKYAGIIGKK